MDLHTHFMRTPARPSMKSPLVCLAVHDWTSSNVKQPLPPRQRRGSPADPSARSPVCSERPRDEARPTEIHLVPCDARHMAKS
jgi:hypothetical protein